MKLAIILLPFAIACATTDNDKPQASKHDAGRALATASRMLDNLDAKAGVHAALPGVKSTVSYVEPCPTSGTLSIDGTFEDDGATSLFDVTGAFHACAIDSEQLDGSAHVTESVSGDEYTSTLEGTLTWQGPAGSATCTFDVQVKSGPSGDSYTGTVCGYDVAELDQ